MTKQEKALLPINKGEILDNVFPLRISTQNRGQGSYDKSLRFPVSLILTVANNAHDSAFNRKDFLRKVSGKVAVWYKPVADFGRFDAKKLESVGLKTVSFGEIGEITKHAAANGEYHLGITVGNEKGIVYNPPFLTPSLREIAIAEDTYKFEPVPMSIADRTQLQLDHVVPLSAWLASKKDGEEYSLLKTISDLLEAMGHKQAKIAFTSVKGIDGYKKLEDACLNFLKHIVENLGTQTTFRLQLIDERHNHNKIYTESTILANTVKKLYSKKQ